MRGEVIPPLKMPTKPSIIAEAKTSESSEGVTL